METTGSNIKLHEKKGKKVSPDKLFKPFKPWYKNAYSPYCSPYISSGISKENLSWYQDILSLVINSYILITWILQVGDMG